MSDCCERIEDVMSGSNGYHCCHCCCNNNSGVSGGNNGNGCGHSCDFDTDMILWVLIIIVIVSCMCN